MEAKAADCKELTPDVLVVGAGPTGVPLAIGLQRQGYRVLLVEKQAKAMKLFKGEFLQPAATKVLQNLGLYKVFERPSADSIKELHFTDLDEDNNVLSDLLMEYPLGTSATSICHHDLISALREHAREELGDWFLEGAQVSPANGESNDFQEAPKFSLKQKKGGQWSVRPRWVLGCDGRNSTVRKWLGGESVPRNAPVAFGAEPEVIVGAETSQGAALRYRYEVIRFWERGTLSAFSLGELGQRIYLSHQDTDENISKVARPKIQEMLQEMSSFYELGQLEENGRVLGFPAYGHWFGSVHSSAFLLVGDATGVSSPYCGQGIMAGLEHVTHLLEKFDFHADPMRSGKRLGRDYAREVSKTFSRVQLLNLGLFYLFFSRAPVFKPVASYILGVWKENPELQERVVRLFGGLDTDKPSVMELMRLWGITKSPLKNSIAHLKLIGDQLMSKNV